MPLRFVLLKGVVVMIRISQVYLYGSQLWYSVFLCVDDDFRLLVFFFCLKDVL